MDFGSIPLFSMLYNKLSYTGERQAVLAQTLSNLDTPGFVPKDLAPVDFAKMAKAAAGDGDGSDGSTGGGQLRMATTSPLHLSGLMGVNTGHFAVVAQRHPYEKKPVKNSVVLEEQSMKLATNAKENQEASLLYRKMAAMFRTAIGNR